MEDVKDQSKRDEEQGKPRYNRQIRSLDPGRVRGAASGARLGDGRAVYLPIPSAAWQPSAFELGCPDELPKAHGFASPACDGFARSRM
jgi:hypothetical protein